MAVGDRFLKHACVVIAALAIPLLVPHAVGHLPVGGAAAMLGVGDAVPSGATLERSPLAPGLVQRPAETILVNPGDTVDSLAAQFHSDASAIRWANDLRDLSQPLPGTPLLIPPGPGSLVRVHSPAERPSQVAARLGLDPRVILDYNALRSDAPLREGTWVQVPRGAGGGDVLYSSAVVPVADGTPGVPSSQRSRGPSGRFPWGQCTYYVSTKRRVAWDGDAWTWYRNARAFGRPEGQIPVQGAIAVTWGSWVGHVAYVERVNPDGSFVVSEMNVRGVGVIDQRTLTVRSADMIGFIY